MGSCWDTLPAGAIGGRRKVGVISKTDKSKNRSHHLQGPKSKRASSSFSPLEDVSYLLPGPFL